MVEMRNEREVVTWGRTWWRWEDNNKYYLKNSA
jgi:hypothetical protein